MSNQASKPASKPVKKESYKAYKRTLDGLIKDGTITKEQAEETLARKVKAGELTNPNAGGGGANYSTPELDDLKRQLQAVLEDPKNASKVNAVTLAGYTIRIYTENSKAKKAKQEKDSK